MISKSHLRKIIEIRHFETLLLKYFRRGAIHGTTHTSVGQEDIAVCPFPKTIGHDGPDIMRVLQA